MTVAQPQSMHASGLRILSRLVMKISFYPICISTNFIAGSKWILSESDYITITRNWNRIVAFTVPAPKINRLTLWDVYGYWHPYTWAAQINWFQWELDGSKFFTFIVPSRGAVGLTLALSGGKYLPLLTFTVPIRNLCQIDWASHFRIWWI